MKWIPWITGISLVAVLVYNANQRPPPRFEAGEVSGEGLQSFPPLVPTAPAPNFWRSRPGQTPRDLRSGRFEAAPLRWPDSLSRIAATAELDPPRSLELIDDLFASQHELDSIIQWARSQPGEAALWLESLPEGSFQNAMLERMLGALTARDPPAALELSEKFEAPGLRDGAVSTVLRSWAALAPHDALRAAAARADGSETSFLGRAFVSAATTHPEHLADFLGIAKEHSIDRSFLACAAESLLAKDPKQLAHWWQVLQDPGHRSAVAEVLIQHAGRNNPELAFDWATQLSEPSRRQETLQLLLHRAFQRRAESAHTLLESPWLARPDRDALLAWLARESSR